MSLLRTYRERKKLTQSQLAGLLSGEGDDVSRQLIGAFEARTRQLTVERAQRIRRLLGLSNKEFLALCDERSAPNAVKDDS